MFTNLFLCDIDNAYFMYFDQRQYRTDFWTRIQFDNS